VGGIIHRSRGGASLKYRYYRFEEIAGISDIATDNQLNKKSITAAEEASGKTAEQSSRGRAVPLRAPH